MEHPEASDKIGPKVRAISNTFSRIVNSSTAEFGLTAAQSFILRFLYVQKTFNDTLPCQHDIELKFNIKHPTATGILKRLFEKGYVIFKPDKNDKRLKRIAITNEGIEASEATRLRLDETETRLTRNFSQEELYELHRLLNKLLSNTIPEHTEFSLEEND